MNFWEHAANGAAAGAFIGAVQGVQYVRRQKRIRAWLTEVARYEGMPALHPDDVEAMLIEEKVIFKP